MCSSDLLATFTKEQQDARQGPMYESDDPIGRAIWKAGIYSSIARLHNCTCIRSPQNQAIHVLGRRAMVDVARSVAEWVIRSIEREMPIAWDAVEGKASINRRSFHTSFGNGASGAVSDTVDRILAERKKGRIGDEQLSRSQALVLSNQDKRALQESEDYLKRYMHIFPRGADPAAALPRAPRQAEALAQACRLIIKLIVNPQF
mgnify:CR=1 FL=1